MIRTKITQGMSGWGAVVALLGRPSRQRPTRGADTILYLASSPAIQGVSGKYVENKRENLIIGARGTWTRAWRVSCERRARQGLALWSSTTRDMPWIPDGAKKDPDRC